MALEPVWKLGRAKLLTVIQSGIDTAVALPDSFVGARNVHRREAVKFQTTTMGIAHNLARIRVARIGIRRMNQLAGQQNQKYLLQTGVEQPTDCVGSEEFGILVTRCRLMGLKCPQTIPDKSIGDTEAKRDRLRVIPRHLRKSVEEKRVNAEVDDGAGNANQTEFKELSHTINGK